ncbi:MAG: FUSC family protein [Verrucomicrobia bacterium]|nr:FUSC family protein [Verrucomicrobiota bacterium]
MPAQTESTTLLSPFSDMRVRYGIKLSLASLLSFYVALDLRLEHPNWAVLTTLVMMNSNFVGSTALKALLRCVGTIAGAFLGVWLVGTYTSSPVLFLLLIFIILGIAVYKFGQYPSTQAPYAYYLVGVTTLSVATYGIQDPSDVWRTGLNRALEILDGSFSSLAVTSIIWPRYASEEFFELGSKALETVAEVVSLQTASYIQLRDRSGQLEELRKQFEQQVATLRNLLQAGAQESTRFYGRLGNYNAFVVSLTNLFQAAVHLETKGQEESLYIARIQNELAAASIAVAHEFQILLSAYSPGARLPETTLDEAFDTLSEKLSALRAAGLLDESSIETNIDFYSHIAALRTIRYELLEMRQIKQGLPRLRAAYPERKRAWDLLPTIDWLWMKIAFKSALASALSLLLIRWVHPPGPAVLPLAALLFSVLQRNFIRAGNTGDLRAFQRLFFACLILSLYAALLILITPFSADYLAMNLVLFVGLFIFGFLTARTPGLSFWGIVSILATSVFVGLNPQVPVASDTIIDSVVGLITGMAIATVIGRLIWPLLPQRLLRDDLVEFLGELKELSNPKLPMKKIQTRLALLPIEALQAAKRIRLPDFTGEHLRQFELLIRALSALAARRTALARLRFELPTRLEALVHSELERLEIEFGQMTDAFADCFRKGDCRREFPTVRGALDDLHQRAVQIRREGILATESLDAPIELLEIISMYQRTGDTLEECASLIKSLSIHLYWGDYAL